MSNNNRSASINEGFPYLFSNGKKQKKRKMAAANVVKNSTPTNSMSKSFTFPDSPLDDCQFGVSKRSLVPLGHPSRLYKIIVVGEVACGKSALIKRYVHNYFGKVANYRATIGVDFQLKLLKFNDELDIRLQLWDIAGQERFSSMTRAYYKGAVGAVVMFDQTDVRTFHAAFEKWKADIDEKVLIPGGRKIPVLLVCNKSDLPKDPRLPNDLEISRIVQEYNFIPKWFKTSAKNGEGVKDAFNVIVRYIMAMDTWNEPLQDPDGSLESSFASYPGSISWLQEQHQQQSKDEVFEANNENVVRLDSRRRSANNDINRRKCC